MRFLLLICATLAAAPAAAREYTLLIHEAPAQLALRDDAGARGAAYWSGFAAAGTALAKAGALKGGAALEPRAAASLGKAKTTPTPSGYFIIEAPDLATARALAATIPAARTGRVDIIAHAPAKTGM